MNKKVSFRELEIIVSKMQREFGQIRNGSEGEYTFLLLPMESNLLRVSRQMRMANGRRALEAVHICLLTIKGYLEQTQFDYSDIAAEESAGFVKALLHSFDPFTNNDIRKIANKKYDLSSPDDLHTFFTTPVKCLLKIGKSIDFWTREYGASGYFDFIDGQFGAQIKNNSKMDFSVVI